MKAATPALQSAMGDGRDRSIVTDGRRIVLLGFAISLALSWPRLIDLWQHGTLYDTDDAMRLVQVRDWLNGQGWYDLRAYRLSPPDGLPMHWSRIVDVPVGALIRLFAVWVPVTQAETLARIVFPLALQLCLLALAARAGSVLAGPGGRAPAVALTVLSGFMFEQFPAGRIDHHAPQIVLLMGMVVTLLSALTPRTARHAVLTGICMAASLAISLENMPFMAVMAAALPLTWIFRPRQVDGAVAWLAAGLIVGLPVAFLATVPPSHVLQSVGDAFSAVHLFGGLAGAGGLLLLRGLTGHLSTRVARLAAVAAVALAVAGGMMLIDPACFNDPYEGLSPMLRHFWLSRVTEAQSLLDATRERPATFTVLFCPLLAGALGAACACGREIGIARLRFAAILMLILVGCAGTLWEIRVASSVQPIAALGGMWVVTRAAEAAQRRRSALGTVAACLLALPFGTLAWAFVPMAKPDAASASASAQTLRCRQGSAFVALAVLEPGLVFAPTEDGAHLMAYTRHSVVAGPYHRNLAGNAAVIEGLAAAPDQAADLVRRSGARYVVVCPGEAQISSIAREVPGSLADVLQAGRVPDWLIAIPLAGTPYRAFAVR